MPGSRQLGQMHVSARVHFYSIPPFYLRRLQLFLYTAKKERRNLPPSYSVSGGLIMHLCNPSSSGVEIPTQKNYEAQKKQKLNDDGGPFKFKRAGPFQNTKPT
jgi:hypothetical protein